MVLLAAVLQALAHCHRNGVAHRCVSPEAVVFPANDSCLGDAKQLLCLLLAKDPSKRLTASEALGECCSDEGL